MSQNQKGLPLIGSVTTGFTAPLQSLRFLLNHKFVMFIGLAPQVVGLVLYVWLSTQGLLPKIDEWVMNALPEGWNAGVFQVIAQIFVSLILIILYAVMFLPLIGAIASPLYDYVATQTFQKITGRQLPKQDLMDTIRGIGSEVTKLLIYYFLLILTFVVSPLAPIFLVFSIWYLGWDLMDRTLTLMNKRLHQRTGFGTKNILACISLGIWAYIPIVGAAMGFALAAAGAVSVAKLMNPSELEAMPLLNSANGEAQN